MTDNMDLARTWGNNEKRLAFLKDYKAWGVWLTTLELDLTYYRYNLPDDTIIIAMEHKHRTYAGYQQGYKWDIGVRYYVQKVGEPFTPDARSSISAVADLLKDAKAKMQKRTGASDNGNHPDADNA